MTNKIVLHDSHCRYLGSPGGDTDAGALSPFGQFVKGLGLRIPTSPNLRDLIDLGWVEPLIRVRVPESFYRRWKNFPVQPPSGRRLKKDKWAGSLWNLVSNPRIPSTTASWRGPLRGKWYRHWLDHPRHLPAQAARRHRLPTGPGCDVPAAFVHRRREISPWIDFFGYWQAYQLYLVLKAARMPSFVLGKQPDAQAGAWMRRFSGLEERVAGRIKRLRGEWESYGRTFDWLSRYRTLRGIWQDLSRFRERMSEAVFRSGARCLARDLGLSVEDIKQDIRNTLLTLNRRWSRLEERDPFRQLLRQDIAIACNFVVVLTGKSLDYDDPIWAPRADRQPTRWTPLIEALPFEVATTKAEFAPQAVVYLAQYNSVVAPNLKLDEGRVEQLLNVRWEASAAVRRFSLAFARLHQHYSEFQQLQNGDLVETTERTPIDFLVLCALQAERILVEAWNVAHPGNSGLPDFSSLVKTTAPDFARVLGVSDLNGFQKELAKIGRKTKLHRLEKTLADPFLEEADFGTPDPRARFLLKCLFNLAVMRNYSAHHDCLDDRLLGSPMGGKAMEALLVVVLLAIQ